MDEAERKARIEFHRKRAAKYGFIQVPAVAIYYAFEKMVGPDLAGFTALKEGLFGRQVSGDIVQLLKFQALKGASYGFRWGVSLSYMPHAWKPKPQWHRSLKSARFDLFEEPYDYLVNDATPWQEQESYYCDTQYGEKCFHEDLRRAWRELKPEVITWFASTETLTGVLEKASAQMARAWSGPFHYPPPDAVRAITLAKLGRLEAALIAAEEIANSGREVAEPFGSLSEIIRSILSTGCD